MNNVLACGLLLAAKHFLADGPLQRPYQYLNKGKLGHPGGVLHAWIHGVLTALIFSVFGMAWVGIVDGVSHYVIDYAKVNLSGNWSQRTCEGLLITSNAYFIALVLDQCCHFAVYVWTLSLL